MASIKELLQYLASTVRFWEGRQRELYQENESLKRRVELLLEGQRELEKIITALSSQLETKAQFMDSQAFRPPYKSAEYLRWLVLLGYGFQPHVIEQLRAVPFQVADLTQPLPGGLCYCTPGGHEDHIELAGAQHEAALHELAHVAFEDYGHDNPDVVVDFLRQWVRVKEDPQATPLARAFSIAQTEGSDGFKGVLWSEAHQKVINPNELPVAGVFNVGIDWDHAFVNLCSWTMGYYQNGDRRLPAYMWPYLNLLFTGRGFLPPYYVPNGIS